MQFISDSTFNFQGLEYQVMNKTQLKLMLRDHKKARALHSGDSYADFSNVYLKDADLSHLDLRYVKFIGCYFDNVKFIGTNLFQTDFRDAMLYDCNADYAQLNHANLRQASIHRLVARDTNFRFAEFANTILDRCNLEHGNFDCAYLYRIDLSTTNLQDCNFIHARLLVCTLPCQLLKNKVMLSNSIMEGPIGLKPIDLAVLSILPEGDIIGYKRLCGNKIAKLLIPAAAKRSNGTGRKCRAEYATVLSIDDNTIDAGKVCTFGYSQNQQDFMYEVGHTVHPDKFDDNPWDTCSNGIHFFITREEAIDY